MSSNFSGILADEIKELQKSPSREIIPEGEQKLHGDKCQRLMQILISDKSNNLPNKAKDSKDSPMIKDLTNKQEIGGEHSQQSEKSPNLANNH